MRSVPVHAVVRSLLLLLAALPAARAADPPGADTQPDARMLRYPDVSASEIAFVYADDIWLVPREGGVASPLASPAGPEQFPRFSPDGTRLAFMGNYEQWSDGNTQFVRFNPIESKTLFLAWHDIPLCHPVVLKRPM